MSLLYEIECCLLMVGPDNMRNRQQLDGAAGRLQQAGLSVETRMRQGDPDDIIASEAAASDMDLIIMGAFGHSRIRTLIIR